MLGVRNSAVYRTVFCVAIAVLIFGCEAKREFDTLPNLRKAPVFSGINYDGQPFHSSELNGKIWIADFIFTTCAEICPKMSDNTARLIQMTDGKIPVVSITVDPEYDSLPILREYAAKYAGGNKWWHFISMPLDSVRETSVKGFAVGNYENPIEHSSRLIVVDEKGIIRGYYDGVDSSAVNALAVLLKEATQ
ncbi:SCO family protein [Ignavibacteria bacterium]|nr:SCO family protein [Bacteroidota bacterium]